MADLETVVLETPSTEVPTGKSEDEGEDCPAENKKGKKVKKDEIIKLDIAEIGEPTFNMPEAKLGLAKLVLLCLFILILLAFFTSFIPDEYMNQRAIKLSDNLYQSIVPIVSMVIGYYFAKD